MKWFLRVVLGTLFVAITIYIFSYETERYEAQAVVALKDLSQKQAMDSLGSILMSGSSETTQSSKLLELYIKSHEMYDYLEYEFHLSDYYTSEKIDELNRLYKDTKMKYFRANEENLLRKYNDDLVITYDDTTGTLAINFANADRNISKTILQSIIDRSAEVINQFEKENAKVALSFIEKQSEKNKEKFIRSIKQMIRYQNKNQTYDPNVDVKMQSTIIANLESELMQKEVEYNSKAKFFNKNTYEMRLLKDTMLNIKKNIEKVKNKMTGGKKSGRRELNENVFDFELLKNEMEFNKEIYKQSLINREELKIEVSQNAKNLLTISTPIVSESYAYPEKYKDTLTAFLILALLYGILMAMITIVRDHRE